MLNYIYGLATDKFCGPVHSLPKLFLCALSFVYGIGIRLLMFFYGIRPYRAGCKVISVGNVTLGGTGKTPLVEYIVRRLKERGQKVAIVTRGYKKSAGVQADEPQMLLENLGDTAVVVDADRARGIKRSIAEYGAKVVVLDDGFQQWRIKKDLDIVAIDSFNPFGNRRMIPAGILRQPLSSLRQAGIFVLTKADMGQEPGQLKEFLRQVNPAAPVACAMHAPAGFYELGKKNAVLSVDTLKGKTAALLCAVADPGYLAHSVRSLGINITAVFEFPDHHAYSMRDMDKITSACKDKGIDIIITTEKDAVKLNGLQHAVWGLRVFVLRAELKIIKNEEPFLDRLFKLCGV